MRLSFLSCIDSRIDSNRLSSLSSRIFHSDRSYSRSAYRRLRLSLLSLVSQSRAILNEKNHPQCGPMASVPMVRTHRVLVVKLDHDETAHGYCAGCILVSSTLNLIILSLNYVA